MESAAPAFISYSRKDYYFAESLTFHLLKLGIPAWLDIKDLRPGVFWNQDLEAALDAASCLILVASAYSLKSPNVRVEWERARRQGKRIIVVLFRPVKLPAELAGYEQIDFRGAFTPALKRLVDRFRGTPTVPRARFPFVFPPWIAAIALALAIPLATNLLVADWHVDNSGGSAVPLVLVWALLPAAIGLFVWALFFSFLRRRMGMTHLLTCLLFCSVWSGAPFFLYAVHGQAALLHYAAPLVRAVVGHELWLISISVLPLVGLGILLVIQPHDLLRWTPTGKVWGWFRARNTPKMPVLEGSEFQNVGRFHLLHDALDEPAATRLKEELIRAGAEEPATLVPGDTTVLLLTARTRLQWLEQEAKPIQSKMLAVVGTRIGLPAQLDWLWQREWIDFRHWNAAQLNRKSGLLRVPEAVSGIRFPFPVRVAQHLLCAALGLSLMLLGLVDPTFGESTSNDSGLSVQNIAAVAVLGLFLWYIPLVRKLLRRTTTEKAFYRYWPVGVAAVCLEAIWGFEQALTVGRVSAFRAAPVCAFLIAWPILFLSNRRQLAFWFPSATANAPNLACKGDWQAWIWAGVYALAWTFVLGTYRD